MALSPLALYCLALARSEEKETPWTAHDVDAQHIALVGPRGSIQVLWGSGGVSVSSPGTRTRWSRDVRLLLRRSLHDSVGFIEDAQTRFYEKTTSLESAI